MTMTSPSSFRYLNLANLPNELVSSIAQYLDNDDICVLRLVNQELCYLFSPYLHDSITFSCHQESLDAIKAKVSL